MGAILYSIQIRSERIYPLQFQQRFFFRNTNNLHLFLLDLKSWNFLTKSYGYFKVKLNVGARKLKIYRRVQNKI